MDRLITSSEPLPPPPLPCPDDACLLYLVRHGATVSNLADPPVLQGRGVDHGLCEIGRRQAQQTAALLAGIPFSAVYSSTMQRARETAETIAAQRGLDEVATSDRLVEVDVGRWEGMTWAEIMRRDPEGYRAFDDDPLQYGYPGGETILQVQARATAAITEMVRAHPGRSIVVVGHAVVNRMFLAGPLGLSPIKGRELSQDNCAVNVVRFRDGKARVVTLNSTFHLSSENQIV